MKYVNYDNLETAKEMIKVALEKKVDKEDGKGLSTNDYTNEEKIKLAGIEEEANKTIVDSELNSESTNPVENKIVKEALDAKADKTAVEEALETKADKIAVEEALDTKADKTAVEEALETKADKQEVTEALDTKVDKEPGKGLSTNDFTTEEKEKLSKLDTNSNENVIEVIKQNGEVVEIINKSVNITVPTDTSELTNNAGFQTSTDVTDKITEAMKDINVDVDLTNYVTNDELNQKGYLTSFTEEDPTVPAHVKAITEADITKWNSGTGSGDGSCNVVVSSTQPTNGEPIWIQTCKNLMPILNDKLTIVRRAEPTVPVDGSQYYWNSSIDTTDNSVTVSGTPSHYLYVILFENKLFKKGTYTLSYTSENKLSSYDNNAVDYNRIHFGNSLGWERNGGIGITGNGTITLEEDTYMSLYIANTSTMSHMWKYCIQIESGSKATSYELPGGKNAMFINYGSGTYEELETNVEVEPYTLPPATANTLGGIKVGDNLTVDADGTLHAQAGGSGGTTIISDGINVTNAAITCNSAASYSIQTTNTYEKINLSLLNSVGDGLTCKDGAIVIGEGITKVRVGYHAYFHSVASSGLKYMKIQINGADNGCPLARKNISDVDELMVTPFVMDVQPGDVLTLMVYGTAGDFIYGGRATVTVEKINEVSVLSTEQNNGTYMWIHNSAAISLPSGAQTKLPFDNLVDDTSNGKLIHEDGGIRIGKGVKQILVISKWNSWTYDCQKYIYVYKNGVSYEAAGFQNGVWTANVVSYVNVTEGDLIEIYGYHNYGSNMNISSNNEQTGLKVVVLGETANVEITGDVTTNGNINAVGETNEIFRAGLSAAHSATLTKAWEKHVVPFNIEASKIGENLSLTSEGRIKIGSGISKIAIKGSLLVCGSAICTLDARLCVLRDGANVSSTGFYTHLDKAKDYRSSVMMNPIVDVQENDEVYIVVTSDTANTLTIANDAFLLVEKINDTNVIAYAGSKNNMLTASLPAPVEITQTDVFQKINSFVELNKIGDKFYVENGVIKIGAGVSKVKVSYNAVAQATVSSTRVFTYLMLNDSGKSQESYFFSSTGQQVGNSIPIVVLDVNEGDEITLGMYGPKGNKVLGATTFVYWTQITVEELNETTTVINGGDTTDIYSTEEIKTNKIWIDNKPIYRKVFTSNKLVSFVTNITDIDCVTDMRCTIRQSNGQWRPLPWLYSTNDTIGGGDWAGGFFFTESTGYVNFQAGSSLSDITKYTLTLEYTKTTD